jgi:hypothetical protein
MATGEACVICLEPVVPGKSGKPPLLNCPCYVSIHESCWLEYYQRKGFECPFCHTKEIRKGYIESAPNQQAHNQAACCCCSCISVWAVLINILGCMFG